MNEVRYWSLRKIHDDPQQHPLSHGEIAEMERLERELWGNRIGAHIASANARTQPAKHWSEL